MLRCCILFLLLVGEACATTAPTLSLETYVLDNGLQVILHEDHTLPMAAVNVWYHVGSKDEKPGRSGFAHLFEHMMFQGSVHYDDDYFLPLQNIGGTVNGSTNQDRTNYWENVPADQLQRALFLEADRMGWLLPALNQAKLDNQRDVVMNEKRQDENRPYGRARAQLYAMLYPLGHPYRTPVIGSMADLGAATRQDVTDFFRKYYAPNNASLCVVGDFSPAQVKAWIARYFGSIPPGPPLARLTAWLPQMTEERRAVATAGVELPRLYMAWHTPAYYAPGDAEFDLLGEVIAGGKTSRLHQKLVFELGIAQDVRAFQSSRELGSVFEIRATAAPGHSLAELEVVIDRELSALLAHGTDRTEVELARAGYEAAFVRDLERLGGFGGVADRLNRYHTLAGTADYLAADLARYEEADKGSVDRFARRYLSLNRRAVLYVKPEGHLSAASVDSGMGVLPGSTGPRNFVPPPVQSARLDNGLAVYLVERHALPLVEVQLHVMSGWSSGAPGVAALTADLLDEGVRGHDALGLAESLKAIGARLYTTSTFDGSVVALNVLRKNLDQGMKLMRAVVREPVLAADALERVRRVYLGRQQQEKGEPRVQAIKELQKRCFGVSHPYAQSFTGTGTREALQAVTRGDLLAYYDEHYRPGNAALVVVGDLSLPEAVALAKRAFGHWDSALAAVSTQTVPAAEPYTGAHLVVIDRPGAKQSYLVGGYADLSRGDADHLVMEVVNSAFGGQFASRINLNLREDKGYTYGVRSELMSLRHGGLFVVSAPVETGVTAAALRELRAEMAAMRSGRPLVGRELADNRDRLVMGFPGRFSTCHEVANGLGELLANGLSGDEWQTYTQRVGAVSEQAAGAAVQRHLDPDRMVWVVVGDWQVIGPSLTALGREVPALGMPEVLGGG